MGPQAALDVLNYALWTGLMVAGPLLGAALLVGAGIGLIQALIQVQEATLTFVPKVLAVGTALALFATFMGKSLGSLMTYTTSLISGG